VFLGRLLIFEYGNLLPFRCQHNSEGYINGGNASKKKKEDFLRTIKYNLGQMEIYIGKIERGQFDLNRKNRSDPYYENDLTGEMEHHLNRIKKTFKEAEKMESDLLSEEEELEEEETESKEASVWKPFVARAMRRRKK